MVAAPAVTVVAAYLLGSIPTGFLMGRLRGVDIRQAGSGNIGATNALRVLGKPAGIAVLVVDTLKGLVATTLLPRWVTQALPATTAQVGPASLLFVLAGIAVVLGHNYTCWLRFRGGKGVATSAGALAGLLPWALLTVLTVFLLTLALCRIVSLGSLLAAAALPFAAWYWHRDPLLVAFATVLAVLAVARHRSNIQRLLTGTEPRLGQARPTSPPPSP